MCSGARSINRYTAGAPMALAGVPLTLRGKKSRALFSYHIPMPADLDETTRAKSKFVERTCVAFIILIQNKGGLPI